MVSIQLTSNVHYHCDELFHYVTCGTTGFSNRHPFYVTNASKGSSEREWNTELQKACPLYLWNDFQTLTMCVNV